MAEPLDVSIRLKEMLNASRQGSVNAEMQKTIEKFSAIAKTPSFTSLGSAPGGQSEVALAQSFKIYESLTKKTEDLIKVMQENTKAEKASTVGMSGLSRSMLYAGAGTTQTLSALARGDVLGAVSGGMNIATGVSNALKGMSSNVGKIGFGVGAAAAIPLAMMGMGAQNLNRSFGEGFSNQQKVEQMRNIMGMGATGILGGKSFTEMAAGELAYPGRAADVGYSFATAAGKGMGTESEMQSGIRLFLASQKNFGISADKMATSIGHMVRWGTKENLNSVFMDSMKLAFSTDSMADWGQMLQAQGGIARALTFSGRGVGAGGYAQIGKLLAMGQAAKYDPAMTQQAVSATIQGLPGAMGSPQQLAFLQGTVGLSTDQIVSPGGRGALEAIVKFAKSDPKEKGIQNATHLLTMLQGTVLAPMRNLIARTMFPKFFDIEGKGGGKALTDKELIALLGKDLRGESTAEHRIQVNTKKMADALTDSGQNIVQLLTTMDGNLHAVTVGAVKWFAKSLPDSGYHKAVLSAWRDKAMPKGTVKASDEDYLMSLGLSREKAQGVIQSLDKDEFKESEDIFLKKAVPRFGTSSKRSAGEALPGLEGEATAVSQKGSNYFPEPSMGSFSNSLNPMNQATLNLTINNSDGSSTYTAAKLSPKKAYENYVGTSIGAPLGN